MAPPREKVLQPSVLQWSTILQKYMFFLMQKYLTDTWGLSFTHAAAIVNIWEGVRRILPVFLLFLADAFLGNFAMLVISGIADCLGMALITMSTPPALASFTDMCKRYKPECIGDTHKVLFYTGLALVALGLAGYKATMNDFLQQQGIQGPTSCFLGFISVLIGLPLRILAIALPSMKHWSVFFGVITVCTAFAMLVFLSGSCVYIMENPGGSPITSVGKVFVSFALKIFRSFPRDGKKLHLEDEARYRTKSLRFLEKAAIDLSPENEEKECILCSVEEVEETKTVVRMIPLWSTFIVSGMVSSIGNTYFVEQADHMNRRAGKWNVPLPIFLLFTEYWCWGIRMLGDLVKEEESSPIAGLVMTMISSVLCCITAAKTEGRRLSVARDHGLLDKPDAIVPMRVFWLFFQFLLLSGVDAQAPIVAAFHENEAPESLSGYFDQLSGALYGFGYIFSVLSVYVVGQISAKGSNPSWFQFTLNRSRLDKYYWTLTVLSSVNLVLFVVYLCIYVYSAKTENGGSDGGNESDGP